MNIMSNFQSVSISSSTSEAVETTNNTVQVNSVAPASFGDSVTINTDAGVLHSSTGEAHQFGKHMTGAEAGDGILASAQTTFFKTDAGSELPLLKAGEARADNAIVTLPNGQQTTAKVAHDALGLLSIERYAHYTPLDGGEQAEAAVVDGIKNPEVETDGHAVTELSGDAAAAHELLSNTFNEQTMDSILQQVIEIQSGTEGATLDADALVRDLGGAVTAEQIDQTVATVFLARQAEVNDLLAFNGITTEEQQLDFARHMISTDPNGWKNSLRTHYHSGSVTKAWGEAIFNYAKKGSGVAVAQGRTKSAAKGNTGSAGLTGADGNQLVTIGNIVLTVALVNQLGLI